MNLFKKVATVEEIHEEFDSAEERVISQCDKMLQELQIPTETQVERKAKLLKEIGFENSSILKEAQVIEERNKGILNQKSVTSQQLHTILEFKQKYPLDKFITVSELERICQKYNLIHAPVANYIKDVPEKNLLEIKNSKLLSYNDESKGFFKVKVDFWSHTREPYVWKFKNKEFIFPKQEYGASFYESDFRRWVEKEFNITNFTFSRCTAEFVDKKGFFIAAPNSHFNLKGLNKKSKFGFFKTEIFEVKDPVVFQYCKNDICRIITKWGTEDDQSYLDPALINEKLN